MIKGKKQKTNKAYSRFHYETSVLLGKNLFEKASYTIFTAILTILLPFSSIHKIPLPVIQGPSFPTLLFPSFCLLPTSNCFQPSAFPPTYVLPSGFLLTNFQVPFLLAH
jgi:hypothetical protein